VAAARLADVGAADPQPPVLRRRGKHPLEQLPITGLELSSLAQLNTRFRDSIRKRVPDRLQLTQPERPRHAGRSWHARIHLHPRKRLGEERRKLSFKPPDLPPQLNPRKPLVAVDAKRIATLSVKQLRHNPTTSLDQGRDPIAIPALRHPSDQSKGQSGPIPVGPERLVLFLRRQSRTAANCLQKKLSGGPAGIGPSPSPGPSAVRPGPRPAPPDPARWRAAPAGAA
jgi:hypothetical protein